MIRALFPVAFATALILTALTAITLPPAQAASREEREKRQEQYRPKRVPGGRLPKEAVILPVYGWRLGPTLTFPYTLGLNAGYLWPGEPVTYKVGGSWGVYGDKGLVAFQFQDLRVYGAIVYDLVPAIDGGPYVETGLDYVRSSGAVLNLGWPIVPHIGFGTLGRLGKSLGWDLSFTAAANGLLALEWSLLFKGGSDGPATPTEE
jgi:hypothetical protein